MSKLHIKTTKTIMVNERHDFCATKNGKCFMQWENDQLFPFCMG